MAVRFYVDADLLGVAHILAALRSDLTYPGDPGGTVKRRERSPCPVESPHLPDHDWLPVVGGHGWAVLTRDRRIERRPAERQAVIDYSVKLFAITSPEQLDKWRQLEILRAGGVTSNGSRSTRGRSSTASHVRPSARSWLLRRRQPPVTFEGTAAPEVRAHAEQGRRLAEQAALTDPRLRPDGTAVVHSERPGCREFLRLSRRLSEVVGCYVHVITDDLPAAEDTEVDARLRLT